MIFQVPAWYSEAHQCLARLDPKLDLLFRFIGPIDLNPDLERTPFESLIRAVANQQLNGRAAETILNRFIHLFPGARFPTPEQVAAVPHEDLCRIGFSRAKARYIQEIVRASLQGLIPSPETIQQMEDDAIVDQLTQIKGIGRWSVEMYLIFGLGRPDVLPIHDFGIQKGFGLVYGKRSHPKPAQILKTGKKWRPHRTLVSRYLWRVADQPQGFLASKNEKGPAPEIS